MSFEIALWIVIGGIIGFVTSRLRNRRRRSFKQDMTSTALCGTVGAWLFTTLGPNGIHGINFYSLLVAVVGAGLLMAVHHTMRRPDRGYDANYFRDTPEAPPEHHDVTSHHDRHNSLST